jgi:hypothetical protein
MVWAEGEQCLNPDDNNAIITNEITFEVDVIPKKENATAEDIDKAVRDIKRMAGLSRSLGIDGVFIRYINEKRFIESHTVDFGSTVTLKVKYLEYRNNP